MPMGNKRSYQKQLRVQMKYVPAPDVQEKDRLSRVVNILLKAARRNISESEDSRNSTQREPPCKAPREDASTGRGRLSPMNSAKNTNARAGQDSGQGQRE